MKIIDSRETFYRGNAWNGSQVGYFEELMKSEDYMDQIVCARMGYGLERLENHPNELVRQAVALAGWYDEKMAKDPCEIVREAVAQNAAVVELRPEVLNILLEDESFTVKATLVQNGLGLDKFAKDKDYFTRGLVAETGYAAETLRYDDQSYVRAGVAKALPIIETQNPELALSIALQLVDDPDWFVRCCLAETGYCKQTLINDPVPAVRNAAAKSKSVDELINNATKRSTENVSNLSEKDSYEMDV